MKNVIITGAGGGLGKNLAERFARAKYNLSLSYFKNKDKVDAVARKLEVFGGKLFSSYLDIGDSVSIKNFFYESDKTIGLPNILINNAAALKDRSFLKMSEEEWDEIINIDLKGVFYCCREAAERMKDNGGGHIINIGSMSGLVGRFGQANYATAKSALIGLTKSLAKEMGTCNIKVNLIIPGFMESAMTENLPPEAFEANIKRSCLKRLTFPEDVAKTVLAISETESVSGQVIILDSRISDFTI